MYVYEQKFAVSRAGKKDNLVRSGVIVLVKLVDFSEGVVLPHEHTLSGPKIDRYEHLEATRLNVGQILGSCRTTQAGLRAYPGNEKGRRTYGYRD